MFKKLKIVPLGLLLISVVLITGCETVKGMGKDISNVPEATGGVWDSLVKADKWMRDHMW